MPEPVSGVPVVMLTACSRYTIVLFSSVKATTYIVLVDGSITGVLRMPSLPTMFVLPPYAYWAIGTGVAFSKAARLRCPQCGTAHVGVERVERVAHGGDVHDVVSGPVDHHARHVERLRHDVVIDGQFEHQSEAARDDVGGVERGLAERCAGNVGVITALQDRRRLSVRAQRLQQRQHHQHGKRGATTRAANDPTPQGRRSLCRDRLLHDPSPGIVT